MFNFFKNRSAKKRDSAKVELVSIHIPKTAGTSFRNILKKIYGDQQVIRLDISLLTEELKINEQQYDSDELPADTSVIHGHFTPKLLRQRFDLPADLPMITWLRHPVDRVISNFYYLEKRLREELQEEAKGLNILSKMQRSLPEYARDELNQNRQHKFLEGLHIEDLAFVGIQEHYSEDLARLSRQLAWPDYEEVQHNITGTAYQIDKALRQEIADLNPLDMALYQKALQLRQDQN